MAQKSSFQNLINGETPVFIDFHATWCGPCKAMEPVIKELAADWKGKVKIIKIDIDRNQQLAGQLGIRGVPTFALYQNGKQLWRQSGMMGKAALDNIIKGQLQLK